MEAKINKVDNKVDDLNKKFDELQVESRQFQTDMLAKINELTNAQGSNGNPKPTGYQPYPNPQAPISQGVFSDGSGVGILLGGGDFFRPPNPNILLINTMGDTMVSGEKLCLLFRKLAGEAGLVNIDNHVIAGPALGSRFEVTFDSAPAAKQFLASLYLGKDSSGAPLFKEQLVEGVGESVQVFFNPDKNSAQIKKEVLAKKMSIFLQAWLPQGTKITVSKVNGRVFASGKKLVSILIKDEGNFSMVWDKPNCQRFSLDCDAIGIAFQSDVSQSSS